MTAEQSSRAAGRAPAPRGRRPGESDVRPVVLAAAAAEFGERGYQGATIRRIAAAAGVDGKLVHYYFGTKEELFRAVIVEAFEVRGFAALLAEAGGGTAAHPASDSSDERLPVGTRFLLGILRALEDPAIGPTFIGLVRNLGTHEESRQLFLRFITEELLERVAPGLPGERGPARLALAGTQVLGIVMARFVVRVPPLVELSAEELALAAGPTIERYLAGDIHFGGWP